MTRVQLTDKIENVDQIWCRLQKKTNIKINHFKTDNGAFLKLPNISTFFGQVFFFCGAAQRLRQIQGGVQNGAITKDGVLLVANLSS